MRRLSIPQKPDRPDIDDLIFGDDNKACRETAAAWFFYTCF